MARFDDAKFRTGLVQAVREGARWEDLPRTVQSKIANSQGAYPEGDAMFAQYQERTAKPQGRVQNAEATGGGRIGAPSLFDTKRGVLSSSEPKEEQGFLNSIKSAKAKDDAAFEEHGILGGLRSQMGLTPDAAKAKSKREGPSLYEQTTTDLTAQQILDRDKSDASGEMSEGGISGRGKVEISPEQDKRNFSEFNAARKRNGKRELTKGEYDALVAERDKQFLEAGERGEVPEEVSPEIAEISQEQTTPEEGALSDQTQARDKEVAPTPYDRYTSDPINYDKETPFYQTEAFDSALLSFTMGQIMGYSTEESIKAAAQAYKTRSETQQREGHKEGLLKSGYQEHAIDQWITSGDRKDLGESSGLFKLNQITAPSKFSSGLYQDNHGNVYSASDLAKMGIDVGSVGGPDGAGIGGGQESTNRLTSAFYRATQLNKDFRDASFPTDIGDAKSFVVLDRIAANNRSGQGSLLGDLGGMAINKAALSQPERQFYDMTKSWVETMLRPETGAAISAQEYSDWRRAYFPYPGDTPADVGRKENLREMMVLVNGALGGAVNTDKSVINNVGSGVWNVRHTPTGVYVVDPATNNVIQKVGG